VSVASAAAAECTYQGVAPDGQCFVIRSANIYLHAGTYPYQASVTSAGEPPVVGTGIAEIQTSAGPSLPQIRTMVGIVTMQYSDHSLFSCTATVIASPQMNLILTAEHCKHPDLATYIEFAPAHTGDCTNQLLSDCAGFFPFGPSQQNPFGIWTARTLPDGHADVWMAGSQFGTVPTPFGPEPTHDYAFIILRPNSVTGQNVQDAVSGLPIQFFYGVPPKTQKWSAFAYDADVPVHHGQDLQSCINSPADASISASIPPEDIAIKCKFGYPPTDYCFGCSGGPWINGANGLPAAVGALNDWFICPTCGNGGPPILIGDTMGQDAVPVFIGAATTPPP
jgi:hypothetical protein